MTRYHVTGHYRTHAGRIGTFQRAIVALDAAQALRIAHMSIIKRPRYAGKLDLRAERVEAQR